VTTRPWDADRPLTKADVRATLRAQFPDITVDPLTHLGSGWEFDVFTTGDDWVFRFPRRSSVASWIARESAVLALVRTALEPDFVVPKVELEGAGGPWFPYSFVGHRRVPGVEADAPEASAHSSSMMLDLADFLGRLHAIDPHEARVAGLEIEPDEMGAWLSEVLELEPSLRRIDPRLESPLRWLLGPPAVPPPYRGAPRVLHNDLCPDHLLVDPGSGRLVGVIDWTDTAMGDPVLDFVVFAPWRGWRFTQGVLAHYPIPLDEGALERLDFLSKVLSLEWLHDAVERGGDLDKHLRWVANAFGETWAESPRSRVVRE
jgi:aminoglycoside phosphotransferase (APT) family kinase protein